MRLALLLAATVAAALATGSRVADRRLLHVVTKPLATGLLLAVVLLTVALAAPGSATHYGAWIATGLALSLVGDIFLLFPKRFLAGLVAFLLAHLAYLVALAPGLRLTPWALLLLPLGVLVYLRVAPSRGALRVPVAIYTAVILSVVAAAASRALALPGSWVWLVVAGVLLFAISDTLLAYQRFHRPLPWGQGWVLCSYYLGQGLIAISVASAV